MRCTQHFGLNDAARKELAKVKCSGTQTITTVWLDGRTETSTRQVDDPLYKAEPTKDLYYGMFDSEEYSLMQYRNKSTGNIDYVEFLQSNNWSSGPCLFLALRDGKGEVVKESLWSDEEIREA